MSGGTITGYPAYITLHSTGSSGDSWVQFTDGETSEFYAVGIRRPTANYGFVYRENNNYYKILHTGNIGTISVGNADTLDGNHLITQVTDWNTNVLSIFKSSENVSTNAPSVDFCYGLHLRFHRDENNYYTDLVTTLYHDGLYYRRHAENGYSDWKTIAFTDSNVASATYATSAGSATSAGIADMLATTCYIWGQPFDGTGDVSGAPSFPSYININRNSSTGALLDTSKIGLEIETYANYASIKTYTSSGSNPSHLILHSSGNVLIGDTTDNGTKLQIKGHIDTFSDGDYTGVIGFNRKSSIGGRYNTNFNGWQIHNYKGDLQFLVERPAGAEVVYHIEGITGNVGIGTIYPKYKLDVNGTLNATTIYQNGTTLDNTYLKLSGGTITSSSYDILTLDTTYAYNEARLVVAYKENAKTLLGWNSTNGSYIYNVNSGSLLGIKEDGTPIYNGNTLIHSGNIGSQSVNYATSAGSATNSTFTSYIYESTDYNTWYNVSKATVLTSTPTYLTAWSGDSMVAVSPSNITVGSAVYASSAGKLQTSRTIWGQSFNGTGNISGDLYITTGSYLNIGTGTYSITQIKSSSSSFYIEARKVSDSSSAANVPIYIGWRGGYYPFMIDASGLATFIGGINTTYGTFSSYISCSSNITALGEITAGSDIRYKSIQNDVILDTRAIANAPIFDFRWIDREDDKLHLGTSAQYWLDYAPNAVTNGNDFYSLNYGVLGVAIGVSNAKKLLSHEEKLTLCENRIEQLENENKQLRNELNQLRYGIN